MSAHPRNSMPEATAYFVARDWAEEASAEWQDNPTDETWNALQAAIVCEEAALNIWKAAP